MTDKNEIKLNWNIIERFVEDIALKSYQNTAQINKNEYLDLFKFVWFCCGFNFYLPGKQEDYNGYYILYLIEKFPLALYKIFFENKNENNADIVASILEIINKTDDIIDSNKNQETHSLSDNETPEKRIQFVLNKMLWFSKENTEYLLNKINGIHRNPLLMKEQIVFLDGEYNKIR
jgi:hypothetical protein